MIKLSFVSALTLPLAFFAPSLFADTFLQTNLVSDGCSTCPTAAVIDPNLKDPWGIGFSATSPFWVSDRAAGVTTIYMGNGTKVNVGGVPAITVPPGTAVTGPTGQVFAGISGNFLLPNGNPSSFIFDTLGGTIDGWNAGSTAIVMATTPGANYTGLALANNTLYAANFKTGGSIDVFNSSFAPTTLSGHFTDPNGLPSGFAPFNVQNLNGVLYVEYAQTNANAPVSLSGGGFVDEFDTNGNFIKRLAGNAAGSGPLNAPWGVAVVPGTGFGAFAAGDVLIGNFFSGDIDVFDTNGNFIQTLKDANGNTLVNSGLWAITFDSGATDARGLYFTAGINQGNDGVFGKIDAVPEPAAWSLAVLGLLGLGAIRRQRSLKK